MKNTLRISGVVVAANLLLFILVTSSTPFREIHHHWIFPLLAATVAIQWFATRLKWLDFGAARATLLFIMAFLILMGWIRHATIFACFDNCAFKFAGTCVMAALLFFLQARLKEAHFWSRRRSWMAGLICSLFAVALIWIGL